MNQTDTKTTTVGDVAHGIGTLVKKGVSALREGANHVGKQDFSPKAIKEKVESTALTTVVKYAAYIAVAYLVWRAVVRPLLFRR